VISTITAEIDPRSALLLQHFTLTNPCKTGATACLANIFLSPRRRQQRDPLQHRPEPLSV
jgi:hypothetical protein